MSLFLIKSMLNHFLHWVSNPCPCLAVSVKKGWDIKRLFFFITVPKSQLGGFTVQWLTMISSKFEFQLILCGNLDKLANISFIFSKWGYASNLPHPYSMKIKWVYICYKHICLCVINICVYICYKHMLYMSLYVIKLEQYIIYSESSKMLATIIFTII